jgi:hypothetical protein
MKDATPHRATRPGHMATGGNLMSRPYSQQRATRPSHLSTGSSLTSHHLHTCWLENSLSSPYLPHAHPQPTCFNTLPPSCESSWHCTTRLIGHLHASLQSSLMLPYFEATSQKLISPTTMILRPGAFLSGKFWSLLVLTLHPGGFWCA